jgi:arginine/serine-rich splicing factor 4/5/6
LKDHCRKYGEVTYTDAHFRSGEGRGEVCFVERADMDKALEEMDGEEIMGKRVKVSESDNVSNT